MKSAISYLSLVFFLCYTSAHAQQKENVSGIPVTRPGTITPLFQLSGGMVYSSIDLSRYISSVAYRGIHTRIVTHIKGMLFVSAEYSKFREHDSPASWINVNAQKFDLNAHISFATNNNLTRIYALSGINKHEWKAVRTGFTDQGQMGWGIPEGEVVRVNKYGINFGCGFTQLLYENIGLFGDYRFCFGNAHNFEKVRIMDVMTTLGITINIPGPEHGKKTYGTGNKIYKWTRKGGRPW